MVTVTVTLTVTFTVTVTVRVRVRVRVRARVRARAWVRSIGREAPVVFQAKASPAPRTSSGKRGSMPSMAIKSATMRVVKRYVESKYLPGE